MGGRDVEEAIWAGLPLLLILDHALLPLESPGVKGEFESGAQDRAMSGRMPVRWVLGSREQPSPGRLRHTVALRGGLSPAFAGPLGHN